MTYIALLKAINVGGRPPVKSAALRAFAEAIGLGAPETLLQTGNLVFTSSKPAAALERLIEAEAPSRLGLEADAFVRAAADWDRVVAGNPFPQMAADDPSHLVVMALKAAPGAAEMAALRSAIKGAERAEAAGAHLYLSYPDGIGTSKLTGAVIERAIRTQGTARNWNTVLKLQAMANAR